MKSIPPDQPDPEATAQGSTPEADAIDFVQDQFLALAKEMAEKPGDILLMLAQRDSKLTPALEGLLSRIVAFIVSRPSFHAADLLSHSITLAIAHRRDEMLTPLISAYKTFMPETFLWPNGPEAPREMIADGNPGRNLSFLDLAQTPEVASALLGFDESDVKAHGYLDTLSEAIVRHIKNGNHTVLKPILEDYKKHLPERWQWPLTLDPLRGPSALTDSFLYIAAQSKRAECVELLLDMGAEPDLVGKSQIAPLNIALVDFYRCYVKQENVPHDIREAGTRIARALLNHNADPTFTVRLGNNDWSGEDLVKKTGDSELRKQAYVNRVTIHRPQPSWLSKLAKAILDDPPRGPS